MTNHKECINELLEKIGQLKEERPTAGTRWRLMGVAADVVEVTEKLQTEVLERVKTEVVMDADADMDYLEVAEQVLASELEPKSDNLCEATEGVNTALGALNGVLLEIGEQLERTYKDADFERLYEAERHRYMSSRAAHTARQTFAQWKNYTCYGQPVQEQIEDYRLEKLVKLFGEGVLDAQVEHIQRAKRYPDEVDFSQLDDDHPLRRTVYRHYAALRKMVDWQDGCLVVVPSRVGRHFYACRHEQKAKLKRTSLLKYMHKVEMVQEELRRLQSAGSDGPDGEVAEQLNFFAPSKSLKMLLGEEWFTTLVTDVKRYDGAWTDAFVEALMHSEWGSQIAREWAVTERRLTLKCMIIGTLKDAGVLRGSYNQIAKLLDFGEENTATLAKYMGLGKKQGYAEWIADYAVQRQEV